MSAWTWLTRFVLGADKEAEEKAAQDRFTSTMNGKHDSEPPMTPDDLEAKLDEIVARVENEAGALNSLPPPASEATEHVERDRNRDTIPDTGRQPESSGEDTRRRDSSGGLGQSG